MAFKSRLKCLFLKPIFAFYLQHFCILRATLHLPSVSMIEKFALKFREDTSFQELEKALNDKQVEIAFRAAHTLKGVCMNLGFDHLYKPSFEITESLRAGNLELALQQFDAVKE